MNWVERDLIEDVRRFIAATFVPALVQSVRNRRYPLLLLVLVLVAVVVVWGRAIVVGYSSDDYQFIHHLAPIRSFGDVLRAFVDFDPNPQYWRPLANASAALDFLMWGWNGGTFHLSNVIFHLVSTVLAFFVARRIFHFENGLAIAVALFFGVAASHESNVLWPAARADQLTALFAMVTVLAYDGMLHARGQRRVWLYAISLFAFALSMLSKELGVLTFVLVVALFEVKPAVRPDERKHAILRIAGLAIVLAAFILVRSHFTIAPTETEPLLSEGARSPLAFLRNAAYGIGYMLVPLDLEQAMDLLVHALPLVLGLAAVAFAAAAYFVARLPKQRRSLYLAPALFMVITGVIAMQSFERWRWYAPSVGLFAIAVLIASDVARKNRIGRAVVVVVAVVLGIYHIYRAESAITDWKRAADELAGLKPSMIQVLGVRVPGQTLDLITAPGKLGGAMVLQNAYREFIQECEAERLHVPGHEFGSAEGAEVPAYKAIDLYAFNLANGYSGLAYARDSDAVTVTVADSAHDLWLVPALFLIDGVSRRHWHFAPGDTCGYEPNLMTIMKAEGPMAKSMRVRMNPDSNLLPVVYDGTRFRVLR